MVKFICYNWMPTVANHVLDMPREEYFKAGVTPLHNRENFNPYHVKDDDLIFVKTDFIVNGKFQREYLNKIYKRFNIITGVSSYNLGRDGGDIYKYVLEHPNLNKWFCTNPPNIESNKIVPLPIGFEEPSRVGGNQKMLESIFNSRTPREEKKDKILLPYHNMSTNQERQALYNSLKELSFVEYQDTSLPVEKYLKLLDKYKFTICLAGRGPDIHRNYEAMLVGSIPINIDGPTKKVFDYHKASAVFLDSWNSLNENLFNNLLKTEYNIENNDEFLKLENHISTIGDLI